MSETLAQSFRLGYTLYALLVILAARSARVNPTWSMSNIGLLMKRIILHLGAGLLCGVLLSVCASSGGKSGGAAQGGRSSTFGPICFSLANLFPGEPGCDTSSRLEKNQSTP